MDLIKNSRCFELRKFSLLLMFCISVVSPYHIYGQHSKKLNLSQSDYKGWHKLALEALSDDGNWVSYGHYYNHTDSLFLHNWKTNTKLSFANAGTGIFNKSYYVCQTNDGILHIISLKTGEEIEVKGVHYFKAFNNFIITHQKIKNEIVFIILDYDGKELYKTNECLEYQVSPKQHFISIVQREDKRNALLLLSTNGFKAFKIIEKPLDEGSFMNLTWCANSSAFAFYEEKEKNTCIHYYNVGSRVLQTLNTSIAGFPSTKTFYVRGALNLSADGKSVFFKIRQKSEYNVERVPNGVQVWNTKDPQIYPASIVTEKFTQNPRFAMWEPKTDRFIEITDDTFPVGGTGGNSTIALVYNPLMYSAKDKFTYDAEIYVTALLNGERKLLTNEIIGGSTNAFISPNGKYVSYHDKGDWKVYNVATGIITNVTENLGVPFSLESMTEPGENGYGNPGWSTDDSEILLYDEFDIWKIKPDGSRAERLTYGREKGIKYRIIPQNIEQQNSNDGRILTVGTFDLNSPLLLSMRSQSNDYNGFALWRTLKKLQIICYAPKGINDIVHSNNKTFVWTEEDVAQSPTLMLRMGNGKSIELHKSNKQQELFHWTKSELLHYQNKNGISLKGILYYPAGFVSGRIYPMIVHIYQKQSHLLHAYTLPSLDNSDGFNISNLTAKGYFVFLPDIIYTMGEIGVSAVDCVEAAVIKALENPAIDAKNVGLIGHSFGGTQTDFIITQSKLFKCAVAGAATTDFVSSHLSVTPNYKIPNFYKIERGQARMMVSPFEDWERYLKNSALYYAANVTTPLLSWTGLQDGQVDYTQSFAFYLALRRLNKEHTMLVYPDAQHDMSGNINSIDLTQKIEDWFDYYLKSNTKPNWL